MRDISFAKLLGVTAWLVVSVSGCDNARVVEQSIWMQKVKADPGHSHWYVERFRSMARAGEDLVGEARLVDAVAPRGARILDAGCGPGRLGGHLAAAGHYVVGVDVDPVLIEAAGQDHPGPYWLVGDLAELDLPARGITEPFDVIVSAGNVMTFLAPSTRVKVLTRLRAHLAGDGRAVIGFGAGREYEFGQFLDDVAEAGFTSDLLLSTWDLRPFTAGSDFLVTLLRPA
jgi:SAM-dependent methyltransferase